MPNRTRSPTSAMDALADRDYERRHRDVSDVYVIILSSYLGETHGAKAGVGRDVDAEHVYRRDVMWRRRVGGRVSDVHHPKKGVYFVLE